MDTDALRGWKEIAAYLKASERSVTRWESTRGLPVHRVPGSGRDAVFAQRRELEAWMAAQLQQRNTVTEPAQETTDRETDASDAHARLRMPWKSKGGRWVGFGALAIMFLAAVFVTMDAWPERQSEAGVAVSSRPAVVASDEPIRTLPEAPITLEIVFADRRPARLGVVPGECGWIDLVTGDRLEICPRVIQGRVAADVRVTPATRPAPQEQPSGGWRTYGLAPSERIRIVDPVVFELEWVQGGSPVAPSAPGRN